MALGRTMKWVTALLVALLMMLGPGANRAEAYIDPGTGSTLLASLGLLLGAVCTGLAVCFWQVKHWGSLFIAKLSAKREPQVQPEENRT